MQSFRIGQQSKGVIAAGILSVAFGCVSADDKAMQEGFVRNGEKATAAPAESKQGPQKDPSGPRPKPPQEP